MPQFRITGQRPLHGSVTISGRKNAALKLIAAALLSDQPVTIHNLPQIGDVATMLEIAEHLGSQVDRQGDRVTITTPEIKNTAIPYDLGRKLRASLVFVGPLLARQKEAHFPHPGGCVIGKRSISPHLDAFRNWGLRFPLMVQLITSKPTIL